MDSSDPSISERTQKLAKIMIVYVSRAVIKALKPIVKLWVYCRVIENDRDG